LARRGDNCYGGIAYYGGIAPLDLRDVSLSKDTDPKQQIDLNNTANEVPFLVTASELRDRKIKRRRKYNAPRIDLKARNSSRRDQDSRSDGP
jgi:hypothetical protein